MMINKVKSDTILSEFIVDQCDENGICVSIDSDINRDSYVIIKVDDYYNSLQVAERPASVDCLIIHECINGGYGFALVELKNISTSRYFCTDNIKEKFETSLYDFIKIRFAEILDSEFKKIKLYFVSNKELYKRDLGLKLETLINLRFNFNEKRLMIEPRMPTPTIKKCY
ncbi:hypothetical protein [Elizabethkingia anophelis]|uniref:hypothetical protein n=1 Tax=Elizabethkingia anophelis TaxID=1117645 RepID=UPI000442B081|nr:hypothetical protein [Elizabethkingia anophelis]QGN24386.1 hypothetical protein GJV56_17615 [Elizabethkingia anophelis]QNV11028.1 hypothetical protein EIY88_17595 [Elizabethkingia anophelis]UTF89179.1 hypothetical protein J2N93_17695 [Elizabethkingia anophelis]UTG00102.1 hypothetical protein J2O04_17910 [Elizabethkingia anophelis]UTG03816.1 hypothetical protein J2O03_17690 [Elizabethkingia anophelis]